MDLQEQDDAVFSVDSLKLYLQEEGLTAFNRIRTKILGTAGLTAVASTLWATATNRRVARIVPALTANAAVAMTTFAVCQEGVRAVRRGDDDAWTSFCAGGLAGAAMTRLACRHITPHANPCTAGCDISSSAVSGQGCIVRTGREEAVAWQCSLLNASGTCYLQAHTSSGNRIHRCHMFVPGVQRRQLPQFAGPVH